METLRAGILLGLVLGLVGCGGNGPIPVGSDGGGRDRSSSSCDDLDETGCRARAQCDWATCPSCNGAPVGGSCVPAGTAIPCVEIGCIRCDSATTATDCQNIPGCRTVSCPACRGFNFAACEDASAPPVVPNCPDVACPSSCQGLDQAMCEAAAGQGCKPVTCPSCSGSPTYAGCVGPGDPEPGCPGVACPSCNGLDQTTCEATPGCRADYCCSFVGCADESSPAPFCPAVACPSCDSLDEAACTASGSCHPVYQPLNMMCACPTAGCCIAYERCAEGKRADCQGPATCAQPSPICDGPYVLSYSQNSCFEGCVRQEECAPPDCRVTGCQMGETCQQCFASYACLPPNVAC
jgi:hypothetical protein